MKKRIIRISIFILLICTAVYASGGLKNIFSPNTVRAFGDLTVNFHVPVGKPIFSIANAKPGDSVTKPIDVTNSGPITRIVAIKGVRTGGVGTGPAMDHALTVEIKNGPTTLYGPVTVEQFFAQSNSKDGILLGPLPSGDILPLTVAVTFPSSAGDEYQGKSVVFDVTFGVITGDNLVINEVFYNVDDKHGLKAPKEKDEMDEEKEDKKTGKKDHNKKPTRYKFQWIEIYNPTDKEISLKNWKIVNNSGTIVINANKSIKPGSFALISKDSSLWRFWENHNRTLKIEVGKKFGDGLDVAGDHLYLTDSKGKIVDKTSWGSDTSGFIPPAVNPGVPVGHSTERSTPGFDTDTSSDWTDRFPSTPGK